MAQTNALNVPPTNSTAVVGNGTGFTTLAYSSASSASSLVQRDSNQNVFANGYASKITTSYTAGSPVTLTAASTQIQRLINGFQTNFVLPDATTLAIGTSYLFHAQDTGPIVIQTNGAINLYTVSGGGTASVTLLTNSTAAGTWDVAVQLPASATFGDTGLVMTGIINTTARVKAKSYTPFMTFINTVPGTTTITSGSNQIYYCYGTSTRIIRLPAESSVYDAQSFTIINTSTGQITIQDSTTATLLVMESNTQVVITQLNFGSSAYNWNLAYTTLSPTEYSGDTGTAFIGAFLSVNTDHAGNNSGASVTFDASAPNLVLNLTDASNNTLLGLSSGNLTLTGTANTGIGESSLVGLTSGGSNVALGRGALDATLTGSFNVGIGNYTGDNYTGAESSTILLNSFGVAGVSNSLRIGKATGTGNQELSTAYIAGIANPTLSAGSPTPYLVSQDISNDQLQALTPVAADAASTAFGSLAVGTALQNTANYPILVNVSMDVTAATTAVILVGVGSTNTPTAQAVTATFTVAAATAYGFSFVVPAKYYAKVTTTGTITVGSITTFASQIG